MEQEQRKRGLFWHEFLYEINRATASLMYLLQGMESVRKTELAPYNGINPEHRQFAASFPKLSYVDVPLCVSGPGFDLNDVLRREGDAEQLAYKGWVEQVYFLWESRFRNEMNEGLQGPDTIRPEGDAIGDFRLIRNDLIHNNGDYPVQPVYVEDLAAQAVEASSQGESSVADSAGPDTFSFEDLLRLLVSSMGVRRWFLHTPPRVGLAFTGLVGLLMRDMALTRDEVVGLMAGLLTSGEPPTGTTRLSDWLAENGDGLGRRYVSELRRNYRR